MASRPQRGISFEILVRAEGRWVLEGVESTADAARVRARTLLESRQPEAVKVIEKREGREPGTVILEEEPAAAGRPASIVAIEDSPVCHVLEDIYRFGSRLTLGRLLRPYLDGERLTALELLHSPDRLSQLARLDTVFVQGLQRLAGIQARSGGEGVRTRLDALRALGEAARRRVPTAEEAARYRDVLDDGGLPALWRYVDGRHEAEDRDFFVRVGLSTRLAKGTDWADKLDGLLELLASAPEARGLVLVDEAMAEILDSAEAVKAILPSSGEVGQTLCLLVDLARGRPVAGSQSDSVTTRLETVMARFHPPLAEWILLERVRRHLAGLKPLSRAGAAEEVPLFRALLRGLSGLDGLLGGPAMSSAVTQRARVAMSGPGNDLIPEDGLMTMVGLIEHPGARLGYLLDMLETDLGARHQDIIVWKATEIADSPSAILSFFPQDAEPGKVMAAVTSLRHRIEATDRSDDWVVVLLRRFDTFLREGVTGVAPLSPPRREPTPATDHPMESLAAPPPGGGSGRGMLERRFAEAGDMIFQEGELGTEAYLIVAGRVNIHFKSGRRDVFLASLGPGEIIGEMSIIDNQPRVASARAVEETELAVIPRDAFQARLDRLERTDRVMRRLIDVFVERLRAQIRAFR